MADWRLYDTHYTERYLGTPQDEPDAYDRTSLVAEVARAQAEERPVRPLLLIHGLADDNVVAAHTLQLSSALLAAGRPHRVPVVGRHPHDAAGGRGREPAAAPTRPFSGSRSDSRDAGGQDPVETGQVKDLDVDESRLFRQGGHRPALAGN